VLRERRRSRPREDEPLALANTNNEVVEKGGP
jgi:hypothetical protein